ncbi:MAG: hypothetical protein ACREJT_00585, partial [Myxococcota bacterium]
EKDTPRYIALTWTKFQLLRSAVDANPFAATRLGWIDIGLAHVANTSVATAGLAFDVVHVPDRVRLEILRPFTPAEVFAPDYFRHLHGIVALGYCTGDLDRLRQLCDLFDREVEAALAGGFAPSEEQIVPRIFAAHPHLFAPYDGDYHTILVNYAGMRAGVSKLVGDLRRAEALGEMAGAARLRSALQTSWGQRRIALSGAALALVLGRTS